MSETDKKTLPKEITLNINFKLDDTPSRYATNILIQQGKDEVVINFFEAMAPAILPDASVDDRRVQFERLQETGVTAVQVAKLTVSKSRFVGMAQAFHDMGLIILGQQPESESEAGDDAGPGIPAKEEKDVRN